MKYKVSVIIPIYNAQDTIQRCIDSIINQTIGFSNIELILYDDKSTDNTRKILKQYSDEYNNIFLILSDENSGYPGKGRNEGIKRATADYIMFMDNDNEYNVDMCETLYNEIINENADIVSCIYKNVDEISESLIKFDYLDGISKDNKTILLNENVFSYIDALIWNKIYKKTTIIENNVKFIEKELGEDLCFNFTALIYSSKIVYLNDYVGYVRHESHNSLTTTLTSSKIKDLMNLFFKISSYYKNNNIMVDLSRVYCKRVEWVIANIMKNSVNSSSKNKELLKLLNYLYLLEKEINFDDSYLSTFYRIPNKLIMKKKFSLTIIYSKVISFFTQNSKLRKFYRGCKNG